jgi:hypothetical protein
MFFLTPLFSFFLVLRDEHIRPLRETETRSRIHERTISLRFLGIILSVLRLEVSVYNVYIIQTRFQTTFAWRGGGQGEK